MQDREQALVQTLLAEVNALFSQMHIRMQSVYYIQYFSATIFAVLVGSYVTASGDWSLDARLLFVSFAPLPLLFLAFLQYREDQLMVSHDRYLFAILRPQILTLLRIPSESPLLAFLSYIRDLKVDASSAALSVLRYGFPLASSVLSWAALVALLAQDATGVLSARQIVQSWTCGKWMMNMALVFSLLSLALTITLLYGMWRIGCVLVPQAYAAAPVPRWERPAEPEGADIRPAND